MAVTRSNLIDEALKYVGVSKTNRTPEFMEITEGRGFDVNNGIPYAWCGDFATYVLEKVGVHDGTALNRKSINGKWNPGQNITMLTNWAAAHGQVSDDKSDIVPGDFVVLIRNAGDHIGLVKSVNKEGGSITTLDGNGWGGEVHETIRQLDSLPLRRVVKTDVLLAAVDTGYHWDPQPVDPNQPIPFPFPEFPTIPGFGPIMIPGTGIPNYIGTLYADAPTYDGAIEETKFGFDKLRALILARSVERIGRT